MSGVGDGVWGWGAGLTGERVGGRGGGNGWTGRERGCCGR